MHDGAVIPIEFQQVNNLSSEGALVCEACNLVGDIQHYLPTRDLNHLGAQWHQELIDHLILLLCPFDCLLL